MRIAAAHPGLLMKVPDDKITARGWQLMFLRLQPLHELTHQRYLMEDFSRPLDVWSSDFGLRTFTME